VPQTRHAATAGKAIIDTLALYEAVRRETAGLTLTPNMMPRLFNAESAVVFLGLTTIYIECYNKSVRGEDPSNDGVGSAMAWTVLDNPPGRGEKR